MKRLGAVWSVATMVAVALVGVSPASVGATGVAGGSGTGCPTRAYVANQISGTVSVIDVASGTAVGAPITVGDSPLRVAFTPDGTTAYVTNSGGNSVSVIDVVSGTVAGAPITVGTNPFGVAFTPCVELGTSVGVDGRNVTVTGSQFAPASVLTVSIASTPTTLGTVTVSADGTFTATYTVTCSVPGGAHTVSASAVSGQSASFPVTLTDCPTPEPNPEPNPEPTFTG